MIIVDGNNNQPRYRERRREPRYINISEYVKEQKREIEDIEKMMKKEEKKEEDKKKRSLLHTVEFTFLLVLTSPIWASVYAVVVWKCMNMASTVIHGN